MSTRRRAGWAWVPAFVAVLGVTLAPTSASSGPPQPGTLEIVGGTYNDADLRIVGTTFLFNPVVSEGMIDVVEITGPNGWNEGEPVACITWRPPAGNEFRSPCWFFVPPVSGTYHATGAINGVTYEADFAIDSEKKLGSPSISAVRVRTHRVKVMWEAPRRSKTFIIRINDYPPAGFQVDRVTAGDSRSLRLSGFALDLGAEYQVVVFGTSRDIAAGGPLGASFNVSSVDVIVTFE